MSDVERTASLLSELKALGVRIAIDDFGTGHSSLHYLQRLGRSFDLQVIAEGIEAECQRQRLLELRCATGQGYLFARPLPPEQLERLGRAAAPAAS